MEEWYPASPTDTSARASECQRELGRSARKGWLSTVEQKKRAPICGITFRIALEAVKPVVLNSHHRAKEMRCSSTSCVLNLNLTKLPVQVEQREHFIALMATYGQSVSACRFANVTYVLNDDVGVLDGLRRTATTFRATSVSMMMRKIFGQRARGKWRNTHRAGNAAPGFTTNQRHLLVALSCVKCQRLRLASRPRFPPGGASTGS